MTQKEFREISIRGRIAYCIKCLNNYLNNTYPDSDFSSVTDIACRITEDGDYIDESAMAFMEIIPEYLYEFDNYEDAEFEYISKDQYESLTSLIPKEDNDLNIIMHSIYDIAMEYCYTSVEDHAKNNLKYIINTVEILRKNKISIPAVEDFVKYDFSINDGWGDFISRNEYMNN